MEYNKIKMTFNNYTQKARLTLLNIHREEVEVNIHQCRTEPEANNCFSIIFRGEYQGLQNNGLKHKTRSWCHIRMFHKSAVNEQNLARLFCHKFT